MRRKIASPTTLFAVVAIVCVAIVAYTASQLGELGRPVAWGIIGASAVLAIWSLVAMWRSQRSQLQESSLAAVFSLVVVVALAGLTAAAFAGVGPFSDTEGSAPPPGSTPGPSAEPTPTPTVDVRQVRRDRGLRVALDAACLGPGNSTKIGMTIENMGNSTLTVVGFRHLPLDEVVESPLADPAHPCHDGILPGQTCLLGYSDDTHLELRPRDLTRETYLVLYFKDETGEEYGVTFTLPPANRLPECG